ncbi:protein translocase subunit SecD [candidate division Kazan bacterium]|uniref:Protein translocase subunit SecD n=1 Tax=candidate division Kazan bacterium TaxID=2202143 RepID=A0A420ZDD9_UNCK3|nr:MAG: protein translocase subunit SecD [candidate division Kazan bacterium]
MTKQVWLISFIVVVLLGALVIDFPAIAEFVGFPEGQFQIRQGLDLSGGTHLVYQTDLTDVEPKERSDSVSGVVEVIRRRVDALGVAEPSIQKTRDNSRVIVELPGIDDVNEAISLIGETAELEFREGIVGKSIDENGSMISSNYDDWADVGLTGANFVKAEVQFAQGSTVIVSEPEVVIKFDAEGRQKFEEVTGRNINKPLAIFLDKQLLSAPKVKSRINSETAVISGGFDLPEAKRLAIQLNAGALPVPIELIAQNNIGATLGAESIQKSIIAGLIGLLMVMLFMIIYYRLPGLVAALALSIYALITLAIFIAIPVTLTLAGIAGFVLSVGMAIDANILIFERMKEEVRRGSTVRLAIDTGFKRAWTSIRDSNIASLITVVILYFGASGLIRGFAVTLGIGILVSLFTALTCTHIVLQLLASTGLRNKASLWMGGALIGQDQKSEIKNQA